MSEVDDRSVAEDGQSEKSSEKESPLGEVIKLLKQGGELFHTPEREPLLRFSVNGHLETLRIGDADFRDWFARLYYCQTNKIPPESAIREATSALAGTAKFSSPSRQTFVRIGEHDGSIYLDLANEAWEAVKISSEGWEVVSDPPIRFRRARGMQALPRPSQGGSIDQLRPLLNISNDDQWVLVVSWLVAALRPTGPYPILVLEGSHGSSKSSMSKLLRQLIDPNVAPSRFAPQNPRDLMISSRNAWCQTFDNLSGVPAWLSDALCRLATGGGFSTRTLYSDDAETLIDATRPILVNGIDVNISRGDLLDRAIMLSLPTIADAHRLTEAEFWRQFESILPEVLGSLLTAVSVALRRLPELVLSKLPRMADFAKWATAAESGFGWAEGTVLGAYGRNRHASNSMALEASPLVPLVERLVDRGSWTGTAAELLGELSGLILCNEMSAREWPSGPRALSSCLRRLAPNLRDAGIEIRFGQTSGSRSQKTIFLSRLRAGQ